MKSAPGVLEVFGALSRNPALAAAIAAGSLIVDRAAGPDRHIVFDVGRLRHRLVLRKDAAAGTCGCRVPMDGPIDIKMAALASIHHWREPSRASRSYRRLAPSSYQRFRLERMLAVLDAFGNDGGGRPSLRELANGCLHLQPAQYSSSEWKSSSQRRQMQRILAEAIRMSRTGYRQLLRCGFDPP